jgi:hypothetical protein
MSVEDTAAQLTIPEATVKTRLHRARLALRRALDEELSTSLTGAFPFGGVRCARTTETVLERLGLTDTLPPHPERERHHQHGLQETIMKALFGTILASSLLCFTGPVVAQEQAPPAEPYKKVSELVTLPDFLPGLGQLYVDPATLPAGRFLAYDHDGKLVRTIYIIPVEDLNPDKKFEDLGVGTNNVDHVDVYFNAGHPGVETPHAHVVLWHVPAADEARVAQ